MMGSQDSPNWWFNRVLHCGMSDPIADVYMLQQLTHGISMQVICWLGGNTLRVMILI
jgi:hypothetical protein